MNKNHLITKLALTFLMGNTLSSQSGYTQVCLFTGDRVGCKRIVAFIGMLAVMVGRPNRQK